MTENDRIKIEKKQEMRTKDISEMISEGGLGADYYYDIVKEEPPKEETDSQANYSVDD